MLLPGKEVFKVHEDYSTLLPPANEVWGKVMFLHLSVILFTGGGESAPLHAGIHSPGRDTTLGRHPLGRNPLGQTLLLPNTRGYGEQMGGTHSTGMHTCD